MDQLSEYRKKRDFAVTSEPAGKKKPKRGGARYLIQKHDASHLHYDFRLELDGVLLSWAVPKGPSLDPSVKRLAMQTEDHPLEYGSFEGTIPEGEYGGGTVMLWDTGTWTPLGDAHEMMKKGHLSFELHGKKLGGAWHLVRTHRGDEKRVQWLLFKSNDDAAKKNADEKLTKTISVKTGRSMKQIAEGNSRVWHSNESAETTKKATSRKPRTKRRRTKAPPRTVEPELALLTKTPPAGDAWGHEVKFDGYRIFARKDGDAVTLLTRKNNDWTARMPSLAAEIASLGCDTALFDGEVVALREDGTSDFQLLQSSLNARAESTLSYYVFDLLWLDGQDLRDSPLTARKEKLAEVLSRRPSGAHSHVLFSSHTVGKGDEVFAEACKLKLEGIVSKKLDSPYRARRGPDWQKIKCTGRQELVIGGFTDPRGARSGLGALLLGTRKSAKAPLVYAGKVGTGFTDASLRDLRKKLVALETDACPFGEAPLRKGVHWVLPKLVAEIDFTEMTRGGKLRHPTFRGLRDDKPAKEVVMETATTTSSKKSSKKATHPGLTHPDRILWPEMGVTKDELASYYEKVASRMLPHVAGRPLTLVRCPNGRGKPCFFQKHASGDVGSAIRQIDITEKGGASKYMTIHDERGLLDLVQLGVLEIHTWGCHEDDVEEPDFLVFDLDPDPSVPWSRISAAALEIRSRLLDLGLESVVKTTGGKGLHVCAPVTRRLDWDTTKDLCHAFADAMVRDTPDAYVATVSKAKRKGKILIDYLRNGRGATFVAPWSTRAREGAPVAMPLRWRDIQHDEMPWFDLRAVVQNKLPTDPWEGVAKHRQSTARAEKALLRRR